ncbi:MULTISPECIES: PAS domain-containing protein [unclassified Undibacterium]|uniref:PAS domain-containing protein n=1 Tax=unclassified Undibacterium TaxID=2630295 RepID=UPI002AC9E756|nr:MULTISPECIES: PAS domain-containing protein [unclassified Undibacterium]MEB0139752.1 PAS domain-containing protein [Undibacterium sp. CCC2.1]MEB0172633.1 PAS domain-containing protein [Undibacterium sp. CCC1.1]MEB0176386.1 PAS domain-containing protein [Undibacterium sp. CCC3.4]MEB0215756.1 PAS domain-containing protein [Undibacterium sp. 5I2]WPX45177.1 PAS domain-containing protein [Undibacterium sp. CCC3.4]
MHDLQSNEIEQLFSMLMDVLPIGIAVIGPDLHLRYINDRHAELNHCPKDQQIGHHVRDYLPLIADQIEAKLRFVLATDTPLLRQTIRAAAADEHDVAAHRLASYYPWNSADGKRKGVLGLIQDATVDDFQEQIQQESQQRLLSVLDNLFAFVGVLELDGTLVNANRAPLEAAGIALSDVIGKKFWDCHWWSFSPASQANLQAAITRCTQGQSVRCDVQIRLRGEALAWIDFMLSPLRDGQGRITHLIPSGIDISQRHAAEAALHRSEEQLRSVIESSDDAIITKSLDGIVTSWNPAAENLLGYTAQEAIGQPMTQFFPPARLHEEKELLDKIARGEKIAAFETERIHQSGRIVHVAVTISPLRDRAGSVIGACKLARDISQQKAQRDMLEQALSEKTALLHEVHHRVKNNLQIVSSLLNLQARKVAPEVARVLAESQGRIKAMALIHQLLYESHNMSEINLYEFLKKLLNLSATLYSADKHSVKLRLHAHPSPLALDVQRMIPCGLVVNELVLNAIKHAFDVGQDGVVSITLTHTGQQLRIAVADNGRGLPDGFQWGAHSGLGSQLIPMFVHQLQGELITESSAHGACISVVLNMNQAERHDAN